LQLFGNIQIKVATRLGVCQPKVLVFPLVQLANDLQKFGAEQLIVVVAHDAGPRMGRRRILKKQFL
jgi:hypothetical protein